VVLALAVAAGVTVAVTTGRGDHNASPSPSATPPTVSAACEAHPVRETCSSVEVGGRAVRYALLRTEAPTADTVLIDLGGPGIAVLSGQFNLAGLRAGLGGLAASVNLLVVEEPWAQQDVPAPCRAALTAFYRAVRSEPHPEGPARALSTACGIGSQPPRWGHSPQGYREAVAAIARTERLALRGVVASSFGSVRWQWLSQAPTAATVAWVVLLRPYPLGATGSELVGARAAAVTRLLGRPLQPLTDTATVDARTTPVTRFDQLSAAVELGYVEDPGALAAVLDGRDLTRIARLSDALWLRYGTEDLSPGYVAYLDEVCPTGGTWPDAEPVESVRGVLVASHLPCRSLPAAAPARSTQPRQPTCVVTSPRDAVTPEPLVRRTYTRWTKVAFVRVAGLAHGSFDGVEQCLAKLNVS
jgi:hypothetical protein